MPEEVLFESEQVMDRGDVAESLRSVADRLASGDDVTFEAAGDAVTVSPPASVEFEVKVEREGPAEGAGEIGLELELEWDEDGGDQGFTVE